MKTNDTCKVLRSMVFGKITCKSVSDYWVKMKRYKRKTFKTKFNKLAVLFSEIPLLVYSTIQSNNFILMPEYA